VSHDWLVFAECRFNISYCVGLLGRSFEDHVVWGAALFLDVARLPLVRLTRDCLTGVHWRNVAVESCQRLEMGGWGYR
jgi:hypothetical protein